MFVKINYCKYCCKMFTILLGVFFFAMWLIYAVWLLMLRQTVWVCVLGLLVTETEQDYTDV